MVGHGCHPGSDQHYQLLDNVQATAHLSGHLSEPIEIVILHTVNYLAIKVKLRKGLFTSKVEERLVYN
jgi:hypothetical protein